MYVLRQNLPRTLRLFPKILRANFDQLTARFGFMRRLVTTDNHQEISKPLLENEGNNFSFTVVCTLQTSL